MLAIGGMTVTELEFRMSYAERNNWIRYVDKNGPLNPMLRMELAIARAILPFLKQGTKLRDIVTWPKVEPKEATLEDLAKVLRAAFTSGKTHGAGRKMKFRVTKVGR